MSNTLPSFLPSTRATRPWFAILACATVVICSCRSVTPSPAQLASSPGWPADDVGVPPESPAGATGNGAAGRSTSEGPRSGAYPVAQVGHVEPAAAPARTPVHARRAPAPVVNAQVTRHAAALPASSAAMIPRPGVAPAWPVRQVANIKTVPIMGRGAAGHTCAACQPGGGCPPALPTAPPQGDTSLWSHRMWPNDEYLCNGGDNDLSVMVAKDWSVVGLHEGDTVAHYDTLKGEVVVEPSNEVCLYAPQFAAVRRVTGVVLHEQHQRSAGLELPVQLAQSGEAESATTVLQPVQPGRNLAINSANRFREKMRPGGLENLQAAAGARRGFLPFEDFLIIRRGIFDNSEKARLSERLQAAYTWSHDASVQVVVDNIDALEASNEVGMQSVYTYEMPDGKPRLRLVKVASKQNALPGETVDFTLRFDNVGDQVIGNVTIIDNLNTRLEYVPDSQECTLDANFSASDNEHESVVLRWEIDKPMEVGDGGVIRFQCRVR